MKKFLFFILFATTFGCVPVNYKKINSMKKEFNESNSDDIIVINNNKFNPTEYLFKKLDGKISNDFIYIYSWVNHLPRVGTNHFIAMVYDQKTKKVFYVNNEENNKLININEFKSNPNIFMTEEFILKQYLDNNIAFLNSFKPTFSSAEVGSEYYLFNSMSNKVYLLKNILLDREENLFKKQ